MLNILVFDLSVPNMAKKQAVNEGKGYIYIYIQNGDAVSMEDSALHTCLFHVCNDCICFELSSSQPLHSRPSFRSISVFENIVLRFV